MARKEYCSQWTNNSHLWWWENFGTDDSSLINAVPQQITGSNRTPPAFSLSLQLDLHHSINSTRVVFTIYSTLCWMLCKVILDTVLILRISQPDILKFFFYGSIVLCDIHRARTPRVHPEFLANHLVILKVLNAYDIPH